MHSEVLGAEAIVPAVHRLGACPLLQLLRAVPARREVLEDDGGEEVEGDDDADEPPDDEVELRPLVGEAREGAEEDVPVVDHHHVPQHHQRRREVIEVVRPVVQLLV